VALSSPPLEMSQHGFFSPGTVEFLFPDWSDSRSGGKWRHGSILFYRNTWNNQEIRTPQFPVGTVALSSPPLEMSQHGFFLYFLYHSSRRTIPVPIVNKIVNIENQKYKKYKKKPCCDISKVTILFTMGTGMVLREECTP
jgi:hypothetical protein